MPLLRPRSLPAGVSGKITSSTRRIHADTLSLGARLVQLYPQSSRAYSVHCDGVGNDRTRGYTGSRTIVLASGVAISSATIALVLR